MSTNDFLTPGSNKVRSHQAWGAALIVFLLTAVFSATLIWRQEQLRLHHERTEAFSHTADHGHALQNNIERALSATHTLAALVRHGHGTVHDFDTVAGQMLPYYPGASLLILAPGGIIRNVVPLAGNEKAIGLNLLEDPVMKREAAIARDTGKLVLAGPLNLVQGGVAAIGRLPVFLDDASGKPFFWGFTNVVMRFPEALVGARLPELVELGFDYELWRAHPDSGQKQVIAASSSTTLVDPVEYLLELPYGNWTLSAAPSKGWSDPVGLASLTAVGLLFSLLLAWMAKLLAESRMHYQGLEAMVARRTADILSSKNQLAAVLEAIPDLMFELGLDGRCHDCHSWRLESLATFMVDLIGHTVREKFPPAASDVVMAALLEAHQNGSSHGRQFELPLAQGRLWFELSVACKASEPGQEDRFIVLARDITERKLAEADLRVAATAFEAQEGMVITDANCVILRVNRAFTQITGYTAAEAVGKTPQQLIKSGTHDKAFYEAMWKSIQNTGAWQGEIWNQRKDGEVFPAWRTITAVNGADGALTHYVGTQTDISERKLAEEKLRESFAFRKSLLQTMPVPVFYKDALGRYTGCNSAFEEFIGKTKDAIVGKTVHEVSPGSLAQTYRDRDLELLDDPIGVQVYESRVAHADGTMRDVVFHKARLVGSDGKPTGIVGVILDISVRKHAEKLEQQRLDELLAIHLLSNAVSEAASIEQVYEEAMDSLLQVLKADRASIQLFDPDGVMRFKAWRGLSDDYRKIAAGYLPWPEDAVDPQPVLVDDVDLDPELARFRPLMSAEGFRAMGFVPLVQQGRLLGKFVAYFNTPHRFVENEMRLAKTIAFHVSFAVERKLTEESLRQSKDMLQMTLRCAPDAVFICLRDGRMSYVNDVVVSMLGYSREELYEMTVFDLVPPDWHERYRLGSSLIVASGERQVMEIRLIRKDGIAIPLELNAALLPNGQVYGSCRDISERKRMERDLRIAATAFEAQEGMVITDANDVILKVNQAFTAMTGYTAEEAVGQTPRLLQSGRHSPAFYAAMWESLAQTDAWQGEVWNRRSNGEVFPVWLTITGVKGAKGAITNYVGTHTDITERKSAEEKIEYLAFFDALTRLPNRRLLADRLQQAAASSARSRKHGALLFLDLDSFKTLNDTLGHDMGDLLLQEVAQRLLGCVREGDTVARLGGDEFVVILADLSENPQEAAAQAEIVGEKIRDTLKQTYRLAGYMHHSTASIGVTLFIGHGDSVDELMKRADLAMYQAKAAGRNTLRFFDPDMQAIVSARASLESDLREAVLQGQFILHYQPQVDAVAGVTGAEVLLRWQHPLRNMVHPSEFISLAEDTGLILPLGHWVLKTAITQLVAWAARTETAHLTLAVNVSIRQFSMPNFVDEVLGLVDQFGADPRKLKLELTESLLMENADDVIAKMTALKARGVSFSLDDFGTGYSSLAYLKRLPLAQLKIDQSFVRDVATNSSDAVIVSTIIALANNMGMSVIAEGVETESHRDFLARHGCQVYQGYLFSRPLPLDEFLRFLEYPTEITRILEPRL